MSKLRIVVAVKSLALRHVVQHLLDREPEVEIVRLGKSLAQRTRGEAPDLVVASACLSCSPARATIAAAKRSYPGSKLIIVSSVEGFARDLRRSGADACLAEEALVKRLLPTVAVLAGSRLGN